MSKVVKLSSVMEREEKLKEIYEGLEEIKDQLTALIDEYEEEETVEWTAAIYVLICCKMTEKRSFCA